MSWLERLGLRRPPPAKATREEIDAWLREGVARMEAGDAAGVELFERVLSHDPADADALFFLGVAALRAGRDIEAMDYYFRAAEARPRDPGLWYAAGYGYSLERRIADALQCYRRALAVCPGHVDARLNLATALMDAQRVEEAREILEAVRLEAPMVDADFVLGAVYKEYGMIAESLGAYRRVLEQNPLDSSAFSNFLLSFAYDPSASASELYDAHRRYGARFARPFAAPAAADPAKRRLRVGYVSPDLRAHVVARFIEPALQHHDRAAFEVYCYDCSRADDATKDRLRTIADAWIDCPHLDPAALAQRVREDGIDILVDLAGHTADNRLRVLAHRPAPVQVTYLGYPGTTGLASIDYRVSDERADPQGVADRLSSERIVRPWPTYFCFRPPAYSTDVGPLPLDRNGYVTFGSFNNFAKMSDPFLDAVAEVMRAVPGSRLLLKSRGLSVGHVAERVRRRLAAGGIDPARVELRGWENRLKNHLDLYNAIDLALDTFPYSGATTTCESLWMGVPVVSLAGDRHAGRMSASILAAVGLGDLVVEAREAYVRQAADLALEPSRLRELRRTMRERMRASPLMDEVGFTRALEASYREMWAAKAGAAAARDASFPRDERLARARALAREGRRDEAIVVFQEVLVRAPADLDALQGLWDAALGEGYPGITIEWLAGAIAVEPAVAQIRYMMGFSLLAIADPGGAVAEFRMALELDPALPKAHNNLGVALELLGATEEALGHYRHALELDPALDDAAYNQGNALRQLGDREGAAQLIARSLELAAPTAERLCNLGEVRYEQLRLDEAEQAFRAALGIDPGHARARNGLGLTVTALGRAGEGVRLLRELSAAQPDSAEAHGNLLLAMHYVHGLAPDEIAAEHRTWAQRHARSRSWQAARAPGERRPARRLNIGYVSADFREHPVARFLEPVLRAHDRGRFRVFGYAAVARPDATTEKLRGLCDEWRNVAWSSLEHLLPQLRADRIDILVDLAGHTEGGRLALFARKPAPVQVTWLGYPDTTGLEAIDYRISDAIADPPGESDQRHAETLVRLPRGFLCYQPPEDAPAPGERPPGAVRFGCFNNLAKVTPEMIALWARVLALVPQASLVLKAYGLAADSARDRIRAAFAAAGIAADRIELLEPEGSHAAHLARYDAVDVALDTFPYNGTTTTLEALWMGVPVVTLAGASHAARTGASILAHAGLPDLVANTPEEYCARAVALAGEGPRMPEARRALRARLQASPLLDAAGFARDLEEAYLRMWDEWVEDEAREDQVVRVAVGAEHELPGWRRMPFGEAEEHGSAQACFDELADASADELHYADAEPVPGGEGGALAAVLASARRALKAGGSLRISVPDAAALAPILAQQADDGAQRGALLKTIYRREFGDDVPARVGLDEAELRALLGAAGFRSVERVREFGLFEDASLARFHGNPVSLNLVARA